MIKSIKFLLIFSVVYLFSLSLEAKNQNQNQIQAKAQSQAQAFTSSNTASSDVASSLNLDLKKAIELALKHNENIKMKESDIDRLENQYNEALSYALPKIDAKVGWNRYFKSPVITADMGPPIGRIEAPLKQPYELQFGATLTQPIWTFGKVFTAMDVADRARETEQFSLSATKLDVEYNTRILYHTVLFAQKTLDIAERSYQNTMKNKRILDKSMSYGRASKYENVKMSADVAMRRPVVMESRNKLNIAIKNLKRYLEIPENTEIVLTENLSNNFVNYDPDKMLKEMTANEPTLKALKTSVETFKEMAKWRKADYYPSIGLFASYDYSGNSNKALVGTNNMFHSFVAGISIVAPIWDSFQRRSVYRQALADVNVSELRYSKAEKDFKLAMESALSSYNTMIETYKTVIEALKLSKQSYELSVSSYTTGKITQTQLNDAELQYTRAELEKELTLYNINNLIAQIDKLSKEGVKL
jgi:outer membrane protein